MNILNKLNNFFYEDNDGTSKFKSIKHFSKLKILSNSFFNLIVFIFTYYADVNFETFKIVINILFLAISAILLFSEKVELKPILGEILTPIPITILGYLILLKTGIDVYSESSDYIKNIILLLGYLLSISYLIYRILNKKTPSLKRLICLTLIISTTINLSLIWFFNISNFIIAMILVIPCFFIEFKSYFNKL